MKDDVEKGAVDSQSTVVLNKAELPELVHKGTDPASRRSNHLRQGLLADVQNNGLRLAFFAKVRQQQQNAGQALLAGIKEPVDQILFHSDSTGNQVGDQKVREARLLAEQIQHGVSLDACDG